MLLENQEHFELLKKVSQAWNNLDISIIDMALDDEVSYASQWVFESIHGKKDVLNYLHGKFANIKSAVQSEQMSISAELAWLSSSTCIVLNQKTKEYINQAVIKIKTKDSKIQHIDLCMIPDANTARLTGNFLFNCANI